MTDIAATITNDKGEALHAASGRCYEDYCTVATPRHDQVRNTVTSNVDDTNAPAEQKQQTR